MASGAPVTPDEITQALAHDLPPDVRLAVRMPGKTSLDFHKAETLLAHLLETGQIDKELHDKVLNSRLSFKYSMPARGAVDFVKMVGEARNPNAYLSAVSNSAGAKRLNDGTLAGIPRAKVIGLDARSVNEVIHEKIVTDELSFGQALELLELVQVKLQKEGALDDEETEKAVDVIRDFKRLAKKMGVIE